MRSKFGSVAFIFIVGAVATTLSGCVWVQYQMEMARGAYTQVVDRLELQNPQRSIIIRNVSVLSEDGETMIPGQTVAIENGLITSVENTRDPIANQAAVSPIIIVDGSQKFLIPGLVDSHVHLDAGSNELLLYLANGVTYVRDMGGSSKILSMRADTLKGHFGPDMFVSGPSMSSETGRFRWLTELTRDRFIVNPPETADSLVKGLKAQGYDSLKMNSFMDVPTYRSITAAAAHHDIMVLGHIPHALGIEGFKKRPFAEVAHIEEFTKMLIDEYKYTGSNRDDLLFQIAEEAPEIAKWLREQGIAVQSTLWLIESLPEQKHNLAEAIAQVEWEYANPGDVNGSRLVTGWIPGNNGYELSEDMKKDPKRLAASQKFWAFYVDALHVMARAFIEEDVIILAGTDAGAPLTVPGFSLHDELMSLSHVGMDNADTLRAATATPNNWTRRNAGVIAPGRIADLVILNANPLDKVGNTRLIDGVIKDGRFYNREHLDSILQSVLDVNTHARN